MVKSLIFVCLILASCASATKIEYRYAELPDPPVIARPELDVLQADPSMSAATIIQLHRSTILKLKSWGLELEKALDVYRKKP